MIFTAYFDESGTHAGAELTGMAGFLGDRRQWQKFESGTCSGSCSRETSYMICASKRCNQRQTSRREDQRLPQVYDLFPQGELVGIVRRLVVERQVMHARVPVTRKFIDLKDRHLALALCRASNAAPACFRPHRRSNPSRSRSPRQPRRSAIQPPAPSRHTGAWAGRRLGPRHRSTVGRHLTWLKCNSASGELLSRPRYSGQTHFRAVHGDQVGHRGDRPDQANCDHDGDSHHPRAHLHPLYVALSFR